MKALILSSLFSVGVVSSLAHADFSGTWVGTGSYTDNVGRSEKCPSMETKLEQTTTQLRIVYERKNCTVYSADHSTPIVLAVKDGRVLFNGSLVGSVTASSISIALIQSDETGVYFYRLRGSLSSNGKLETEERTEADLDSGDRFEFKVTGSYRRQ